jgi:hypothetical protein
MVVAEYITAALDDLGFEWDRGNLQVRGFGGSRTPVEIRVHTKNPAYDIGFRRSGDAYEIVADWWGITETSEDRFMKDVVQRYAYHAARAALEAQGGFSLVSEQVDGEGHIHLVLRRMV